MSAVKGVNKTLADGQATGNRIPKGQQDGRVKVMIDTYEAAALEVGSVISMGAKLPLGAVILDVILHTDNLDNNTTLAVGDAEVQDRYITAVDHGAGAELVTRMGIGDIAGRGYTIDETVPATTDRQITILTAAGIATGTIKLIVLFSQD